MNEELLVSIEAFRQYINYYETTGESTALLESYIRTATQIVENFLGYNLLHEEHTEIIKAHNQSKLYLESLPICDVYELYVDMEPVSISDICFTKQYIYDPMGNNIFDGTVVVTYDSGYHNPEEVPSVFKSTIMRIAALLWSEQDGNIGVSGKSFADGSRSYISYTNYNKYLQELNLYKGRYL